MRVTIKLLAYSEVTRNLVKVGLKSKTHGNWAFGIGTSKTDITGNTDWQIITNAADHLGEQTSLAGFDNRDWHKFTLIIPDADGPAILYCDGQYVMELKTPITDQQRSKMIDARARIHRHGSIREYVPETSGDCDYVFIESRRPGQVIDIDYVEISQLPLTTSRKSLPVLLDLDWQLDGLKFVENRMKPYEGNPILTKADVPDISGEIERDEIVWPYVIEDDDIFRMYFCAPGAKKETDAIKPQVGIYHAISHDGFNWEVTPKKPVIVPGGPNEPDYHTTPPVVLKEGGKYRMWYGAYPKFASQGRVAYAESRDGINWVKSKLDLHSYGGKESNICISLHPEQHINEYRLPRDIIKSDELSKENRYLLIMHAQGPYGFVVDVAKSADGIHFDHAANNARHYGFDAYPRPHAMHGAPFILHESNYFWAIVGYGAKGKGYLPTFTGWATEPDERNNISFGLWRSRRALQKLDKRLKSKDGLYFGRFLQVGNQWWVYYIDHKGGSFNLAKVGKHRMYGLQLLPDQQSGVAATIGLNPPRGGWKNHKLTVNLSGLSADSKVQAELVDVYKNKKIDCYCFNNCIPIEENGYDIALQWKDKGSELPGIDRPLQVKLRIIRGTTNPQIHAVYIRPEK
ncbi:MAG: hypothetical protein ACYSSI_13390 [Planctomycetota bacterium]